MSTPMSQATIQEAPALAALLVTGRRLAETLREENAALALLDLPRAASLAAMKIRATDAFAAAQATATKTGARAAGPVGRDVAGLAADLATLGQENQRLLQRAVAIQSRVIEVIAGAALPRATRGLEGARYAASGRSATPRQAPALAVQARM